MRRFLAYLILSQVISLPIASEATTYLIRPDGLGDFPTIQAAVDATVDGDVIELANGIFTGDGNRDVQVPRKSVTIRSQAGDPGVCTMSCEGTESTPHRAFYFQSGEGGGFQIEAVTIAGGREGNGGGVYFDTGGMASFTDCEFISCTATSNGGAIYCASSSSSLFINCRIAGNSASSHGGGAYCIGTSPLFEDCNFEWNGSGFDGAGIYCSESNPQLFGCEFRNNDAADDGGGACFRDSSSPTLLSCTFFENSAFENGGGIYCYGTTTPTIERSTFYGNDAPIGGCISLRGTSSVSIDYSILSFSTDGVSIFCEGGSSATLGCSDIYGNANGDWVGCLSGQETAADNIHQDPLFCDPEAGDLTLHSDSPCAAENNPCGLVGDGQVGCGPTYPTTVLIEPDGSGDYATIQDAIDDLAEGSTIELGSGTFGGGGNRDIDLGGKELTIRSQGGDAEQCVIDCGGSESTPHKGFIFSTGEGNETVIEGLTVMNGYATTNDGGAVLCSGASPTFLDVRFVDNQTEWEGGAAKIENGAPRFFDCEFLNNEALYGGAVNTENTSDPRFIGCLFAGNIAGTSGGAVRVAENGSAEFEDCTFSLNSASLYAGALLVSFSTNATISGCTFTGNIASNGGGIWENNAVCGIENTIIAFSGAGGAITSYGSMTLSCTVLYGNTGGDWDGSIAGQLGSNGNSDQDPQFCSAVHDTDWNWTLQSDSPCAPANNPSCGLIGAWVEGCGETAVEITTWGKIKAGFR